jgi:hypothetical protein
MKKSSPYAARFVNYNRRTPEGCKKVGAATAMWLVGLVAFSAVERASSEETRRHFVGVPFLKRCSVIERGGGETRENGQYPTEGEDRRCLQASLQTALESWKQE